MGSQITRLALPFQVYALTGSTLAIAALTVVQLVPLLVFALAAGSLADAVDKRRLLLVTQVGLAVTSGALVVLALQGDPPLALLFVVAFFSAGLTSVDQPTRASAVPRLVPAERLPAAMALNQLNYQAASIIGPAFGGVLIATVGLPGAYAIDVLTFVASFVALLAIRPLPPLGGVTRPGLAAVREGLAFVRRQPVLMGTFVIDLNAMILASPIALFPAIALDIFRVGPAGLGILAAAPAAGAFVGALLSGWVPRVRRVGRALVIVVVLWGVAMAGFGVAVLVHASGLAPVVWTFPLALLLLAVAGAVDMFSAVFRNTILQLTTPDGLRGRVTSIHILVVTGGPRLGDIQAALVAAAVGPGLAVVAGGLLCVLGVGVIGRRIPSLPAHVLGEGGEGVRALG